MKIKNPDLLAEFRKKRLCEYCGNASIDGRDPAHVISKGAGGSDIRINLVALCRVCHSCSHAGQSPRLFELMSLLSRREDYEAIDIVDANIIIERLDKKPSQAKIALAIADCSPSLKALVERELKEAGKMK